MSTQLDFTMQRAEQHIQSKWVLKLARSPLVDNSRVSDGSRSVPNSSKHDSDHAQHTHRRHFLLYFIRPPRRAKTVDSFPELFDRELVPALKEAVRDLKNRSASTRKDRDDFFRSLSPNCHRHRPSMDTTKEVEGRRHQHHARNQESVITHHHSHSFFQNIKMGNHIASLLVDEAWDDDVAELQTQGPKHDENSIPSSSDGLEKLHERRLARLRRLKEHEEIHGTTLDKVSRLKVECPQCNQQLAATRFALHYEKCFNKRTRRAGSGQGRLSASPSSHSLSPIPSSNQQRQNTLSNAVLAEEAALAANWSVPCSVCHKSQLPNYMLLCDGCSRVFHMECLGYPLTIPEGIWLCSSCSESSRRDPGESKKRRNQKLSAVQKVRCGRVAVGFDIVEFVCDLCNNAILPGCSRFRCLTCGEFDVCENCKDKGGYGHRSTHIMLQLRHTPPQ